jgi:hypothetical protein
MEKVFSLDCEPSILCFKILKCRYPETKHTWNLFCYTEAQFTNFLIFKRQTDGTQNYFIFVQYYSSTVKHRRIHLFSIAGVASPRDVCYIEEYRCVNCFILTWMM